MPIEKISPSEIPSLGPNEGIIPPDYYQCTCWPINFSGGTGTGSY